MKSTITLLAALCLGLSVEAQTWIIPNTKKTIIVKTAADWCGPCGDFGWTRTQELIDQEKNAITLAVHSTSINTDLNVVPSFATDMEANVDVPLSGVPNFVVSRKNMGTSSTADIRQHVASVTAGTATVNTGFIATWKGDSLIVNTRTKFFSTATGEYYIAIYAYEDSVVAYQENIGNNAVHHNIFRLPNGATTWGTKLTGSSFTAASQQDITFRFTVPSNWKKNKMTVFAVIWKKTGSTYDVANANLQKSYPTSIANTNIQEAKTTVFPNPATNNISIKFCDDIKHVDAILIDITGKKVATLYNGEVLNTTLQISRPDVVNGTYFLQLNTNLGTDITSIQLQ